jgi:hypothetical protein
MNAWCYSVQNILFSCLWDWITRIIWALICSLGVKIYVTAMEINPVDGGAEGTRGCIFPALRLKRLRNAEWNARTIVTDLERNAAACMKILSHIFASWSRKKEKKNTSVTISGSPNLSLQSFIRSVSTVADYGLDDWGSIFSKGKDYFLCHCVQPPIKTMLESFIRGKAASSWS